MGLEIRHMVEYKLYFITITRRSIHPRPDEEAPLETYYFVYG